MSLGISVQSESSVLIHDKAQTVNTVSLYTFGTHEGKQKVKFNLSFSYLAYAHPK